MLAEITWPEAFLGVGIAIALVMAMWAWLWACVKG